MLLYAGNTSCGFKYSSLNDHSNKVKTLGSQSAGNPDSLGGSSETLRNKSIHVPKHQKPLNDFQFGHYLAGLIDGDGHFSKTPQLVIVFNEVDASLAYFIKKKIGFGNVYKVKKAVILVIANYAGLKTVLNLINGKIRTLNKFNQIKDNILTQLKWEGGFYYNNQGDLNNHWLSGFTDANGSFQIINKGKKEEIRLNFQVDQKTKDVLYLIKSFVGGNIYYREKQDTYYYGFGSAKKIINYFDKYHLLSSKHIKYLKWRKVYFRTKVA